MNVRTLATATLAFGLSSIAFADPAPRGQIFDRYDCEITASPSGIAFSALGASPRILVEDGGNSAVYDSSVGLSAEDLNCSIPVADGQTQLALRMEVHEETNCSPGGLLTRWTHLEVVLITTVDGAGPAEAVLSSKILTGYNPICQGSAGEPSLLSIAATAGNQLYDFQLSYAGSFTQ